MKVLEQGELLPDFTWTARCKTCKSKLEVLPTDVERYQYSGDQREPGSAKDYVRCVCPVCSRDVFVAHWTDIPEVVRELQLADVKHVNT